MNLRRTFRENWDAAFIFVTMGLILGWIFFVCCVAPAMGQTPTFQNEVWKATGESISIAWEYPTDSRVYGFRLIRCTESNSCSTIATGGAATREFIIAMNSSKTTRYFLRVRVVALVNGYQVTGPAGSEVIVNRK